MATRGKKRQQPVIPYVPIDLPGILDAPDHPVEDVNDPVAMAKRRAHERELAAQGVRLLTPQFPELFRRRR